MGTLGIFTGGKIELALDRVPESSKKGVAIRLDGKGVPDKVLL